MQLQHVLWVAQRQGLNAEHFRFRNTPRYGYNQGTYIEWAGFGGEKRFQLC